MLKIICDFCSKEITTKQNKGGIPKAFRLEENICNECKKMDLNKKWDFDKLKLEKKWLEIEKEKQRFFKNLLKHQKKEWMIQRKKECLGTFFIKGE